MPRIGITRRVGPVGTALAVWDIWRRLPPKQRQWMMAQARVHGPRIAKQALEAQRTRRKRP